MKNILPPRFEKILSRAKELENSLSATIAADNFADLSKEYAELSPLVPEIELMESLIQEQVALGTLLEDPDLEEDLRLLAQEDVVDLQGRRRVLEKKLQLLLLPRDAVDEKNAVLEIRAGTGGNEAALFAADLLRMYQRYAEAKKWRFEVLQLNLTELGGVRDVSASIVGKNVFSHLKFESGVHRVQRIPETETGGRIHTSAATVAILPEAEEVDIQIDEKDLRIDVFRSSGPGGQSVNTTDSAVRITHIPSGLVVQQQDEKSQHKNKAKALKVLRARLYDQKYRDQEAQRAQDRKSQIGTGDRSERIRTYNFPQGRVTDHRISLTLYQIEQIMAGGLDPLIEALLAEYRAEQLACVSTL